MTKRIITILILTLFFALASCGGPKSDTTKTSEEIDFTSTDKIELTCDYYPEYFVVLSDEQKEYVISLWQEGEWTPGEYKTYRPYRFKAGELIITYDLDTGEFYDETNDKTLFISDEQIEVLRSYFTIVSADAIAQITVGMTKTQVDQILMSPGTGVVTPSSSGAYVFHYDCEDGYRYNIFYLYGTDAKTYVVTNITKSEIELSP